MAETVGFIGLGVMGRPMARNLLKKQIPLVVFSRSQGPVDEIVLSGGCALTPNLQQVLRERFGVPIEVLDPLRRVHFREADFDRDWLKSISPMLAVAVGLAIRKMGG